MGLSNLFIFSLIQLEKLWTPIVYTNTYMTISEINLFTDEVNIDFQNNTVSSRTSTNSSFAIKFNESSTTITGIETTTTKTMHRRFQRYRMPNQNDDDCRDSDGHSCGCSLTTRYPCGNMNIVRQKQSRNSSNQSFRYRSMYVPFIKNTKSKVEISVSDFEKLIEELVGTKIIISSSIQGGGNTDYSAYFIVDSIHVDKGKADEAVITVVATLDAPNFASITVNQPILENLQDIKMFFVDGPKKRNRNNTKSVVSNDQYQQYTTFLFYQNDLASPHFFTRYLDLMLMTQSQSVLVKSFSTDSQDIHTSLEELTTRNDIRLFISTFYTDQELARKVQDKLNVISENNQVVTFFSSTLEIPKAVATVPILGRFEDLITRIYQRILGLLENNNKTIRILYPKGSQVFFSTIVERIKLLFSENEVLTFQYQTFADLDDFATDALNIVFTEFASDVVASEIQIDFLIALEIDVEGTISGETIAGVMEVSQSLKQLLINSKLVVKGNNSLSTNAVFETSNLATSTDITTALFTEVETTFVESNSTHATAANAIRELIEITGETVTSPNTNKNQYVGISKLIQNEIGEFEIFLSLVGRLLDVTFNDIRLLIRSVSSIENLAKFGNALTNIFNLTFLSKVFQLIHEKIIPKILSPLNKIIGVINKIRGQVDTVEAVFTHLQDFMTDSILMANEMVFYLSYLGSYINKLDSTLGGQGVTPGEVDLTDVIFKSDSLVTTNVNLQDFLDGIEYGSSTFQALLQHSVNSLKVFQEIIHTAVSIVTPTEKFIDTIANALGNPKLQKLLNILDPISDVIEAKITIDLWLFSITIHVTDLIDALLFVSDLPLIGTFKGLLGDLVEEIVPLDELKRKLQNMFLGAFSGVMSELRVFDVHSIQLTRVFEHIFSKLNSARISVNGLPVFKFRNSSSSNNLNTRNAIFATFQSPSSINAISNLLSLVPYYVYSEVPREIKKLVKQELRLTSRDIIGKLEQIVFANILGHIKETGESAVHAHVLNSGVMETIIPYLSFTYNIVYPFYDERFLLDTYNLLGGDAEEPYWIEENSTQNGIITQSKNHYASTPTDIKMLNIESYISLSVCPQMISFTAKGNINVVSNYKFGNMTDKEFGINDGHHFSKLKLDSLVDIYLYFNTLQLVTQHSIMLNIKYNVLTKTYEAIYKKTSEISDIVALLKAVEKSESQGKPPAHSAGSNIVYVNPNEGGEDANMLYLVMFDIPDEITNPNEEELLKSRYIGASQSSPEYVNYSQVILHKNLRPNVDLLTGWEICEVPNSGVRKVVTTSFPTFSIAWSNFWKNITLYYQNSFNSRARVFGIVETHDGYKVQHLTQNDDPFGAFQIPYTTLYRLMYESKQTNPSIVPCVLKYQLDESTQETITINFHYTGSTKNFIAMSEIYVSPTTSSCPFNLRKIGERESLSINKNGERTCLTKTNRDSKKLRSQKNVPLYDTSTEQIVQTEIEADHSLVCAGTKIEIISTTRSLQSLILNKDYVFSVNENQKSIFHFYADRIVDISNLHFSDFQYTKSISITESTNVSDEISKIVTAFSESVYNILEITQVDDKLIAKCLLESNQDKVLGIALKTTDTILKCDPYRIKNISSDSDVQMNKITKHNSGWQHNDSVKNRASTLKRKTGIVRVKRSFVISKVSREIDVPVEFILEASDSTDDLIGVTVQDSIIVKDSSILSNILSYKTNDSWLNSELKLDILLVDDKCTYAITKSTYNTSDFDTILSTLSDTDSIEDVKTDFYEFLELVITDTGIADQLKNLVMGTLSDKLDRTVTDRGTTEAVLTQELTAYLEDVIYLAYHKYFDESAKTRDSRMIVYMACFVLDTLLKNPTYLQEFKASLDDPSLGNYIIAYLSSIVSRYTTFDTARYFTSKPNLEAAVILSINIFKYLLDGVAESEYTLIKVMTELQVSTWSSLQILDYNNLKQVSLVKLDDSDQVALLKSHQDEKAQYHKTKETGEFTITNNSSLSLSKGDYIDVLMDCNYKNIIGVKVRAVTLSEYRVKVNSIIPPSVSAVLVKRESVLSKVITDYYECAKTIHSNFEILMLYMMGDSIGLSNFYYMAAKFQKLKQLDTTKPLSSDPNGAVSFLALIVIFINLRLKNAQATFLPGEIITASLADTLGISNFTEFLTTDEYISSFNYYYQNLFTNTDSIVKIILGCLETLENNADKRYTQRILHRLSVSEKTIYQSALARLDAIKNRLEKSSKPNSGLSRIDTLILQVLIHQDTDCQEQYTNEVLLVRVLKHIQTWASSLKGNLNRINTNLSQISRDLLSLNRIVELKKHANIVTNSLLEELQQLQGNLENTHYTFIYLCFLKNFNETSLSQSWSCFNILYDELIQLNHVIVEADKKHRVLSSTASMSASGERSRNYCSEQFQVEDIGFKCFLKGCILFDTLHSEFLEDDKSDQTLGAFCHNLLVTLITAFKTFIQYNFIPKPQGDLITSSLELKDLSDSDDSSFDTESLGTSIIKLVEKLSVYLSDPNYHTLEKRFENFIEEVDTILNNKLYLYQINSSEDSTKQYTYYPVNDKTQNCQITDNYRNFFRNLMRLVYNHADIITKQASIRNYTHIDALLDYTESDIFRDNDNFLGNDRNTTIFSYLKNQLEPYLTDCTFKGDYNYLSKVEDNGSSKYVFVKYTDTVQRDGIVVFPEMPFTFNERVSFQETVREYKLQNLISTRNDIGVSSSEVVEGLYVHADIMALRELESDEQDDSLLVTGYFSGSLVAPEDRKTVIGVKHTTQDNLYIFYLLDNYGLLKGTLLKMVSVTVEKYKDSNNRDKHRESREVSRKSAYYRLTETIAYSEFTPNFISEKYDLAVSDLSTVYDYSSSYYTIQELCIQEKGIGTQSDQNPLRQDSESYVITTSTKEVASFTTNSTPQLESAMHQDISAKVKSIEAEVVKIPLLDTPSDRSSFNIVKDLIEYMYILDLTNERENFTEYVIQKLLSSNCVKNFSYNTSSFVNLVSYFQPVSSELQTVDIELGTTIHHLETIFGTQYIIKSDLTTHKLYEAKLVWRADGENSVMFVKNIQPLYKIIDTEITNEVTTTNNKAKLKLNGGKYYCLNVIIDYQDGLSVNIVGYEVSSLDNPYHIKSEIDLEEFVLLSPDALKITSLNIIQSSGLYAELHKLIQSSALYTQLLIDGYGESFVLKENNNTIVDSYELPDLFTELKISAYTTSLKERSEDQTEVIFGVLSESLSRNGIRISNAHTEFNAVDTNYTTMVLACEINPQLNIIKILSEDTLVIKETELGTSDAIDLESGDMRVTYIIVKAEGENYFSIQVPDDATDTTIDSLFLTYPDLVLTNIDTGEEASISTISIDSIKEMVNVKSNMLSYKSNTDLTAVECSHRLTLESLNATFVILKDEVELINQTGNQDYYTATIYTNKYSEIFLVENANLANYDKIHVSRIKDASEKDTTVSLSLPIPTNSYAISYTVIYKFDPILNQAKVVAIQVSGEQVKISTPHNLSQTEVYSNYKHHHKKAKYSDVIVCGSNTYLSRQKDYFVFKKASSSLNFVTLDSNEIVYNAIADTDTTSFVCNVMFSYSKKFDEETFANVIGIEMERDSTTNQLVIKKSDTVENFAKDWSADSIELQNRRANFRLLNNDFTPTSLKIRDLELNIFEAITSDSQIQPLYEYQWSSSSSSQPLLSISSNVFNTVDIDYRLSDFFQVDINEVIREEQEHRYDSSHNHYLLKSRRFKRLHQKTDTCIRDLENVLQNVVTKLSPSITKVSTVTENTENTDSEALATLQTLNTAISSDFSNFKRAVLKDLNLYSDFLSSNNNTFESLDFNLVNINHKEALGIPLVIIRGYKFKDVTSAVEAECHFDDQIIYNFLGDPTQCNSIIPVTENEINPSTAWFEKSYTISVVENKLIEGVYTMSLSQADVCDDILQFRFINATSNNYMVRPLSINRNKSLVEHRFFITFKTSYFSSNSEVFKEGADTTVLRLWCSYDNSNDSFKGTKTVNSSVIEFTLEQVTDAITSLTQWNLTVLDTTNQQFIQTIALNEVTDSRPTPAPGHYLNRSVTISTQCWSLGYFDEVNEWQELYCNESNVLTDTNGQEISITKNSIPVVGWVKNGDSELHLVSEVVFKDTSKVKVLQCSVDSATITPLSETVIPSPTPTDCTETVTPTETPKAYLKMIEVFEVAEFQNKTALFQDDFNADIFELGTQNDFIILPQDFLISSNLQPTNTTLDSFSRPTSCFITTSLQTLVKTSAKNTEALKDFLHTDFDTSQENTTSIFDLDEFDSAFLTPFERCFNLWYDKHVKGSARNVLYHEYQSYLKANLPDWLFFISKDTDTQHLVSYQNSTNYADIKYTDVVQSSFLKRPRINYNNLCGLNVHHIHSVEKILLAVVLKADKTTNLQIDNDITDLASDDATKAKVAEYNTQLKTNREILAEGYALRNLAYQIKQLPNVEIFGINVIEILFDLFLKISKGILSSVHIPNTIKVNVHGDMLYDAVWESESFNNLAITRSVNNPTINTTKVITIRDNISDYVDGLYTSILLSEDNYSYFIGFIRRYYNNLNSEIKIFQQLSIFQDQVDNSQETIIQKILKEYYSSKTKNELSVIDVVNTYLATPGADGGSEKAKPFFLTTNAWNALMTWLSVHENLTAVFRTDDETQLIDATHVSTIANYQEAGLETSVISSQEESYLFLAGILNIKAFHLANSIINDTFPKITDFIEATGDVKYQQYQDFVSQCNLPDLILAPEGIGYKTNWYSSPQYRVFEPENTIYIASECITADWNNEGQHQFVSIEGIVSVQHTSISDLYIIATIDDNPKYLKMVGLTLAIESGVIVIKNQESRYYETSKISSAEKSQLDSTKTDFGKIVSKYWSIATSIDEYKIDVTIKQKALPPEEIMSGSSQLSQDLFGCFTFAESVIYTINNYARSKYQVKLDRHLEKIKTILVESNITDIDINTLVKEYLQNGSVQNAELQEIIDYLLKGSSSNSKIKIKLITDTQCIDHIKGLFAEKTRLDSSLTDDQMYYYIVLALALINISGISQITNPNNLLHALTTHKFLTEAGINFDIPNLRSFIISVIRYVNISATMFFHDDFKNHANSLKEFGICDDNLENQIIIVSNLIDASVAKNFHQMVSYKYITRIKDGDLTDQVFIQQVDQETLAAEELIVDVNEYSASAKTSRVGFSRYDRSKHQGKKMEGGDYCGVIEKIMQEVTTNLTKNGLQDHKLTFLPSTCLIANPISAWGNKNNINSNNKYTEILMETVKLILMYNNVLTEQKFHHKLDGAVNSMGAHFDYEKIYQILETLVSPDTDSGIRLYTCTYASSILERVGYFQDMASLEISDTVTLEASSPSTKGQVAPDDIKYWNYKLFRYAIKCKFLHLLRQYIRLNIMKMHETLSNDIIVYISQQESDDIIESLIQNN